MTEGQKQGAVSRPHEIGKSITQQEMEQMREAFGNLGIGAATGMIGGCTPVQQDDEGSDG